MGKRWKKSDELYHLFVRAFPAEERWINGYKVSVVYKRSSDIRAVYHLEDIDGNQLKDDDGIGVEFYGDNKLYFVSEDTIDDALEESIEDTYRYIREPERREIIVVDKKYEKR